MSINTSLHRSILLKILKEIYTDTTISPFLGFKGGTAAYFFYNLGRFSVDLDFDLLDGGKADYVFEKVQKIVERYGAVKDARKKRYSLFFLLAYDGKIHGAQNVKIEINLRQFGANYSVKSHLGIPIHVMIPEDMFAHKLVAMYERMGTTNRDIFDVWFFLDQHWDMNKEIVEKRTNISFNEFLQKCIELLEKMNDRMILSGIGELLDEKQQVWVKKNLRTETIFLLKLLLNG